MCCTLDWFGADVYYSTCCTIIIKTKSTRRVTRNFEPWLHSHSLGDKSLQRHPGEARGLFRDNGPVSLSRGDSCLSRAPSALRYSQCHYRQHRRHRRLFSTDHRGPCSVCPPSLIKPTAPVTHVCYTKSIPRFPKVPPRDCTRR